MVAKYKTLTLTARSEDMYTVTARIQGHEYIVDQSAEMGGKDSGARPVAFLLMALGGCQLMTARAFLRRNRLVKIKNIEVEMSADITTEEDHNMFAIYNINLMVDGQLTEEQRTEMKAYVDKYCDVGQILRNNNTINTTISLK